MSIRDASSHLFDVVCEDASTPEIIYLTDWGSFELLTTALRQTPEERLTGRVMQPGVRRVGDYLILQKLHGGDGTTR